jgi:hypothetical protein
MKENIGETQEQSWESLSEEDRALFENPTKDSFNAERAQRIVEAMSKEGLEGVRERLSSLFIDRQKKEEWYPEELETVFGWIDTELSEE